MRRFEATFTKKTENNHITAGGQRFAEEVRYVVTAKDEYRALELIAQEGEDPSEFTLEDIGAAKDQMGRALPEGVKDARI